MPTATVAEAKNALFSLLDRVENGEAFEITRCGKPVAVLKLAPLAQPREDAFSEMCAFRGSLKMPVLSVEELKMAAR
jgi:antitoxin (DNA-binding transcriptional repressor) of toxin-antitoxin stability system